MRKRLSAAAYRFQGLRRIVNPVRIRNGTATVCEETPHEAKAGHWGKAPEKAVRGCGCVSQETCLSVIILLPP